MVTPGWAAATERVAGLALTNELSGAAVALNLLCPAAASRRPGLSRNWTKESVFSVALPLRFSGFERGIGRGDFHIAGIR